MEKVTGNEIEAKTASELPSRIVPDSPQWHGALAAVGVAVLALSAYAPIWSGDYQFLNVDDDEYVTENPHVKAGLTKASLWWALTKYHSHNWHPLTWMSLQLDWQLYGWNPRGFHITNVLLHTANTVLLFFALRSLTGGVWRSGVVAAFFAVHPLHVESVAWVAERKDVLSTLFWMLTIWAYSWYAARPGWGRYLLTLVLFALGLMAKPMLVTLPCVLLLLDYWPLRRLNLGQGGIRPLLESALPLLKEKLPFFALVFGCALLTLGAQQDIMQTLEYMPLSYRLANTPLAYVTYIGMMFWPMHLTVFYPHPGPSISLVQAAAATGVLVSLTALTLWQANRRPYLLVGWLWYLGTLVPVIGLVQVGRQAHADRYTYIPLIGLFLLLAWGAHDLLGHRRHLRMATLAATAGLMAACLALTWRQLPVWQNNTTLWQHALGIIPSGIAHQGLAKTLEKEGKIDEARREYAEALRCDPSWVAHLGVGAFLAKHGWYDEALEHFAKSLELYPEHPFAHFDIGYILLNRGKLDEAQQHLTEAVRLDPNFADGHYYLGLALERQGKFREAEGELIQALRKKPSSANARFHLGVICAGLGRSRDAVQCFSAALQSDPNHVEAHTSLGALLAREGQLTAGREHLLAALSKDPRNARAHFNLGLILLQEGQLVEARRHFADAVAADPNDAEAHRHMEAVESQPGREQFRVLPAGVPSR